MKMDYQLTEWMAKEDLPIYTESLTKYNAEFEIRESDNLFAVFTAGTAYTEQIIKRKYVTAYKQRKKEKKHMAKN